MKKLFLALGLLLAAVFGFAKPPIYITFLWHMHQPIYWPYENINTTESRGAYSFSIAGVHQDRTGPYTSWPANAVEMLKNAGVDGGAQVSFSGSLMENLNNLASAGRFPSDWKNRYKQGMGWTTSMGYRRLELVGFGYHHPLMGLLDYQDIRKQVQKHKEVYATTWGSSYSKGIFPPENAFSSRMIPALVDEGFQWVLVDNIHFDRACQGYPYSKGGNLYPPNPADQQNANPGNWIQMNGLWAPTKVSAPFGYQPHYVQYIDPATGAAKKIIAVPTARYEGNEDGRGGFGALNYEAVLSQLEAYNNDDSRPILVVLHHDGDNFGGGTDSYYHANFANFVNWIKANPSRFQCTTVNDYLAKFPVPANDVITVEDGSWAGADNGDPEFLKWNGDSNPTTGYSPDRNSWGIITAAKNRVLTAEKIAPSDTRVKTGWENLMVAETSCYWYWDGTEMWDSHPARGCNLAVSAVDPVIASGSDTVGPTIYVPQRQPYNPGGYEWGVAPETSDMTVWTYVYDVSGLSTVNLKYRYYTGAARTSANEVYSGGTVYTLPMTGKSIVSVTVPMPTYKAQEFSAVVTGLQNKGVDYWVEAVDTKGNVTRSPIRHVYIGTGPTSDTTPPVCSITFPANGAKIGGEIAVSVNATDNVGVTRVEVYTNGSLIGTDPSSPYAVSFNTLSIPNGQTRVLTAKAFDAAGNVGASAALTVTISNGEPIIQTVHYYSTWSAVNVHYNNGSGWTTPPGAAMTSEGSYWWKRDINTSGSVVAVFNNGTTWDNNDSKDYSSSLREFWIKDKTIYTNNPGTGDVTAPVVSYISPTPASGSTIVKTVTLAVSATDNVGVDRVEFYVGTALKATVRMAPFTFDWDTALAANGSYTVTAKAFDEKGNMAQTSRTYTVNNTGGRTVHYYSTWSSVNIHYNNGTGWTTAPGVAMTSETAGWWKRDNISGTNLVFCFNNGSTWDNNNSKNYSTAAAEVWVKDNKVYTSKPDITAPVVSWLNPTAGSVQNGKVTFEVNAADDSAVSKVEFYQGTTLLGTVTTAPYTWIFDSANVVNGSYTFSAKAYDDFGNTASASRSFSFTNSTTGKTVIRVFFDVGMGNTVYIRGSKGPLSWTKGVPCTWTAGNIWIYETTGLLEGFEYKALKNDSVWQSGANKIGNPGVTNDNYPSF